MLSFCFIWLMNQWVKYWILGKRTLSKTIKLQSILWSYFIEVCFKINFTIQWNILILESFELVKHSRKITSCVRVSTHTHDATPWAGDDGRLYSITMPEVTAKFNRRCCWQKVWSDTFFFKRYQPSINWYKLHYTNRLQYRKWNLSRTRLRTYSLHIWQV